MNEKNDDERIRDIAYGFWLDEGQPQGRDEEHWHRALAALNAPAAKAKPTRKAAAKPRAAKKSATPKTKAVKKQT
ncbi:DUF2934 domain-containing protein [Rhodobacteraceae bacterium]|nr:DUF2934 domain-containing protein [Paracoccaceae bacterium]